MFLFTSVSAQQFAMNDTHVSVAEPEVSTSTSNEKPGELHPAEIEKNAVKVNSHFDRQFRNATDVMKTSIATGTLVYCKIDNIKNEMYYDKKGNLSHSIRYYDESKLNESVKEMVLEKYNGYDIFGVTEISANEHHIYHVKIQSRSTWKTIQVNGDTMNEIESFKM